MSNARINQQSGYGRRMCIADGPAPMGRMQDGPSPMDRMHDGPSPMGHMHDGPSPMGHMHDGPSPRQGEVNICIAGSHA